MKILIVEDEEHLAAGLKFNLEVEGMDVTHAANGEDGLAAAKAGEYAAIVLDVMMPGIDGFEVAADLRQAGNYTPILMLTALGRPEDVIKGFEAGADDYLAKPFELAVFLARIKGLIRRNEWAARTPEAAAKDQITVNGRLIDFTNLQLTTGDELIQLTLMEMKLLRYLIDNEDTAVSRKQILEDVWDMQEDTDTRAIDNFIVRLRRYLEDEPNNPRLLQTVRGIGYRFVRAKVSL